MDAEALVGKVFGDCLVQRVIGTGTTGVVYQAMQSTPLRQVAIKVMTRATTLELPHWITFLELFRKAMAQAETLRHQHIVPIYGYGDSDGLPYIVMAEVEGETLEQRLAREGKLDLGQALRFVEQVAEALDYAQTRDIVHRDLKPATIFISNDERTQVADFLVTAALMDEAIAPMRLSNPAMLDYMSPELIAGKEIDGRADIYSLGAITYRMVTGTTLFHGQTLMKVAAKHLRTPPPSPRALRPELPGEAEQVILKALEKKAADRYASAGEFARLLGQAMRGDARSIHHVVVPPQTPQDAGKAQERFEAGSHNERAATRAFVPRGLSGLPRSPQSRRSSWQPLALSPGDEAPATGALHELHTQPHISAIQPPVNQINPMTPVEHITEETGNKEYVTEETGNKAEPERSSTQVHTGQDRVTHELQQVEAVAGNTGATWRLAAPVKIVSIPVAGQPGQYVTGILPTQPLRLLDEEAPPAPARSARSNKKRKMVLAFSLLVLVVLLGSLGLWVARGILTRTGGTTKSGQTVVSGTPYIHASATAQAAATLEANTILIDPLSHNIHNWLESKTGSLLYEFEDGAYHIINNDPSRIAPAVLQNESLSQPFAYTLTMEEIRGDDTSINNEYGMILRFTAQQKKGAQVVQFYSVEVLNKNGGEYQFWKYDNSAGTGSPWKQLATHPFGAEYHQGLGAQNINTFTILVNGTHFTLIVNKKQVWSITDGSLTSGSIGMLVNLRGSEVAFSNLKLTDQPDQ